MGTVHRNGMPPKGMPHKRVKEFPRGAYDEQVITDWCRANLRGPMQYCVVEFQPARLASGRSYQFTAWFKYKEDSKAFAAQWIV